MITILLAAARLLTWRHRSSACTVTRRSLLGGRRTTRTEVHGPRAVLVAHHHG